MLRGFADRASALPPSAYAPNRFLVSQQDAEVCVCACARVRACVCVRESKRCGFKGTEKKPHKQK